MEQVSPGSPSCWRFLTEGRQLAIYSLLPFWQTSPSKKRCLKASLLCWCVCWLLRPWSSSGGRRFGWLLIGATRMGRAAPNMSARCKGDLRAAWADGSGARCAPPFGRRPLSTVYLRLSRSLEKHGVDPCEPYLPEAQRAFSARAPRSCERIRPGSAYRVKRPRVKSSHETPDSFRLSVMVA